MRFSTFMPPQAAQGKVPAVFFLSGLTCTDENFMVKSGAQAIAARLGLALIVPDTSPRESRVPGDDANWDLGLGAGFYVNATRAPWSANYQMASFVAEELPDLVRARFPVDADRFGIMGHSMGGHGAIVTALRNPGRFKSCSAFAPISSPVNCPWGQKAFRAYLGDDTTTWRAWDSCELIRQGSTEKMPILVDQGASDKWLDQLRPDLLSAAATASGWPVTLRMRPGYDHSYYFVATFMTDHMAHHAAALRP
jgi:S-formylglutathione hydrolase